MKRRWLMGGLGIVLLASVLLAVTGPVRTEKALIVSAPTEVILAQLRDPEGLAAWLPWALGARIEDVTVADAQGDALLVWSTPNGEGRVILEETRIENAVRLRIEEPSGALRLWRLRVQDVGFYGRQVTLYEVYRPSGISGRIHASWGGNAHDRALERGLSLMRGRMLSTFGEAGGSYRPPPSDMEG